MLYDSPKQQRLTNKDLKIIESSSTYLLGFDKKYTRIQTKKWNRNHSNIVKNGYKCIVMCMFVFSAVWIYSNILMNQNIIETFEDASLTNYVTQSLGASVMFYSGFQAYLDDANRCSVFDEPKNRFSSSPLFVIQVSYCSFY